MARSRAEPAPRMPEAREPAQDRAEPAPRGTQARELAQRPYWQITVGAGGVHTATLIGGPPVELSAPDLEALRRKVRNFILAAML
jgi:hypothetical protein